MTVRHVPGGARRVRGGRPTKPPQSAEAGGATQIFELGNGGLAGQESSSSRLRICVKAWDYPLRPVDGQVAAVGVVGRHRSDGSGCRGDHMWNLSRFHGAIKAAVLAAK